MCIRDSPVHVHAVTPIHVDDAELARRQARYDRLSPAGVRVVLHDLGPDGPRALENEADVRASERIVTAALADAPAEADVAMPDCVLDPGVPVPGTAPAGRPVVGLGRAAIGGAVLAGARVGAVARNETIAAELEARVAAFGWSAAFAGVTVLDLAVSDIEDEARWAAAVRPALVRARRDGVGAVLNACSAVEVGEPDPDLPALIDPVAVTLRWLRLVSTHPCGTAE